MNIQSAKTVKVKIPAVNSLDLLLELDRAWLYQQSMKTDDM